MSNRLTMSWTARIIDIVCFSGSFAIGGTILLCVFFPTIFKPIPYSYMLSMLIAEIFVYILTWWIHHNQNERWCWLETMFMKKGDN